MKTINIKFIPVLYWKKESSFIVSLFPILQVLSIKDIIEINIKEE